MRAPDPLVLGDEDPTRVQITSAPRFRVLKTSTYLGASTIVLRAGDRLRYTITVKNIGTDNATGVSIRDQVPANTTYVAGSTTINGTQLNDNAQGMTPLVDGIRGLRAGRHDTGRDARRRDQHAEQRRDASRST